MFNKSIFLLSVMLFSITTFAQSDFDVAQSFMSKKGITLVNDDKALTRGNTEPYSVFNGEGGKGFAIVVNGAVVGYSTDNSASEIPEQLKEMLKAYKASTRSEGKDYPEEFTPRNVTPIEPLIKTKWDQGYPYNDMCPLTDDGERTVTGCAATALAQVLYYYRLPYGCEAFDGKFNVEMWYHETITELPATKFDWDNMLLEYTDGNYTQENVDAVAKLMLYSGALSHCNYGKYMTNGFINPGINTRGENVFSYYLNYEGSDYYGTDSYSDDEMIKVMDKALEAKKPIINIGWASNGYGHCYNIDGRDADGLFHINWGWSGNGDGYFIIATELYKKYDATHNIAGFSRYLNLMIPHATLEYTTGIEKVNTKMNHDDSVYNLQGQRINGSLPKGIYIKNGKKFIVR